MHVDDATGLEGFQEALGHRCRSKNKERIVKLIASELRGSEESEDEGDMNTSKPQVQHTKRQKIQLQPAALET